ncbi:MAG: hypothetical protein K2W85_15500 [Phycisphaerales bacterium]|nr:hypothetical protein [Phycisphaerales bacterium]
MRKTFTRILCIGVCALGAATISAPALAQSSSNSKKSEPLVPPSPPATNAGTPWMPMLTMFALLAIIVGVNCIPSKRGHQD